MPQETEIKLRITNEKSFLRTVKRLGAKPRDGATARVHELNVIFDTPDGALAKRGQLLRIRTEVAPPKNKKKPVFKPRVIVTFKSPVADQAAVSSVSPSGRHKIREEIEMEVSDAGILTKIFEGLGMRGWFRYEKYRTTFAMPAKKTWARGLLIELDETPIGSFVELEGPADAIDRAATELGFSKRDYISTNYLALYAQECRRLGQQPRDMLFTKPK